MLKLTIVIENLIYEIRGLQVMLDSEISVTKFHDYLYGKIVTNYDIGKLLSMFINFTDASVKLERNQNYGRRKIERRI